MLKVLLIAGASRFVKEPLSRAGFKLENKINNDRSVVLPQFGLVGSAVLFARDKNEERLSRVLATLEGVDFIAYEQNGVVNVVNRHGEATIEKRGEEYRYSAIKGDPLDLLLITQQRNGADGFIKDEDWFALTRDGVRPDVVRRIFEGATREC